MENQFLSLPRGMVIRNTLLWPEAELHRRGQDQARDQVVNSAASVAAENSASLGLGLVEGVVLHFGKC